VFDTYIHITAGKQVKTSKPSEGEHAWRPFAGVKKIRSEEAD
jgi:hypothetical protein